MISVKGGNSRNKNNTNNAINTDTSITNITNNDDDDYNIIKDVTVLDLYENRKYILDNTQLLDDKIFYNKQLLFYYKDILKGFNINNKNINDDSNTFINTYIEQLSNILKKKLSNTNTLYHFNRLCKEFNIKHDLINALSKLNDYINNKINNINNINNISKINNGNNNYNYLDLTKPIITNVVCTDEKRLKQVLKFSQYKKEVLYIYKKFTCGIYVKIKDNKLHIFQPFFNKFYRNDWKNISFLLNDGTKTTNHVEYYDEKAKIFRKEKVINDIHKWWNNGVVVDNEYYSKFINGKREIQYWSNYGFDNMIYILKLLCKNKIVNNCEFIINKRDYPIEYDKIPIYSFYSSELFSNICIPTNEDIELIFKKNNKLYNAQVNKTSTQPTSSKELNLKDHIKWEDKKNIALFRGSLTGNGVNENTNQRLKLAVLDSKIKTLDSKITTLNMRDKFIFKFNKKESYSKKITNINKLLEDNDIEKIITYTKPDYLKELNITISKENYILQSEQNKYKYIIYCEGHSAANRYTNLMKTGSVILKVDSLCSADKLWYFDLLQPYVHYVPVKSDLSDLEQQIQWCIDNDNKCKIISLNVEVFCNIYITKENVLNYWSNILNNIQNNKCLEFDDTILKLKEKILTKLNIKSDKIDDFLNVSTIIQKLNLPENLPENVISSEDLNVISNTFDIKDIINIKNKIDEFLIPYIEKYEKDLINVINNIYNIIEY